MARRAANLNSKFIISFGQIDLREGTRVMSAIEKRNADMANLTNVR